jgi:hypothetical protein
MEIVIDGNKMSLDVKLAIKSRRKEMEKTQFGKLLATR